MKHFLRILVITAATVSALSAQNGAAPNTKATTTKPASAAPSLPTLPMSELKRLWDSCTMVDYTYFTMPISMSLDNQKSIRQSLRHIGSGAVTLNAACKPFAKIFFQIKGQIVMDADLFFSNGGCAYFVYNQNGQKKYANLISTEGVDFFNQIISRSKK